MYTETMSYESRELVFHYLYYRVSRHGYVWEEALGSAADSPHTSTPPAPAPAPAPASAALEKLHRVLREVGDSFERQYQQEFADIALQMRFEPDGARSRFDAVAEELFRDGINWGRIVAFFVFGGTLCVESCKRRDMAPLVDSIAAWMTAYLDSSLANWISANGDWVCAGHPLPECVQGTHCPSVCRAPTARVCGCRVPIALCVCVGYPLPCVCVCMYRVPIALCVCVCV
uniref:BCL2 apoptosis regulator n=1 Tax=Callorhinchus milii TaxID=7868 RepID=A0A4W3HHG3_CALMI